MKKILIIPSWYPSPTNRVGGTFFQEQAKLICDQFDINVLFIDFIEKPQTRTFFKSPFDTTKKWLLALLSSRFRSITLPKDDIFLKPNLIKYEANILRFGKRKTFEAQLNYYLLALEKLLATGWVPDLVHAHSVYLGGLVAERIFDRYGIPYILTEHNPFALSIYPRQIHDNIKRAFEKAKIVLLLGRDQIRQLGMVDISVKHQLIYNLVDETFFCKTSKAYQPGDILKLVSIGAASHYKDQLTLLRAMLALKTKGVPFNLTLIGLGLWGNRYDEVRSFITSNNLDSSIKIVDLMERSDVAEHLSTYNIFITTSIIETFSVSTVEALISGLTVITTNHGGGAVDLITRDTGIVVNVKDHESIASAIKEIYLGKLTFNPKIIREYAISICGIEKFKKIITEYYKIAMLKDTTDSSSHPN